MPKLNPDIISTYQKKYNIRKKEIIHNYDADTPGSVQHGIAHFQTIQKIDRGEEVTKEVLERLLKELKTVKPDLTFDGLLALKANDIDNWDRRKIIFGNIDSPRNKLDTCIRVSEEILYMLLELGGENIRKWERWYSEPVGSIKTSKENRDTLRSFREKLLASKGRQKSIIKVATNDREKFIMVFGLLSAAKMDILKHFEDVTPEELDHIRSLQENSWQIINSLGTSTFDEILDEMDEATSQANGIVYDLKKLQQSNVNIHVHAYLAKIFREKYKCKFDEEVRLHRDLILPYISDLDESEKTQLMNILFDMEFFLETETLYEYDDIPQINFYISNFNQNIIDCEYYDQNRLDVGRDEYDWYRPPYPIGQFITPKEENSKNSEIIISYRKIVDVLIPLLIDEYKRDVPIHLIADMAIILGVRDNEINIERLKKITKKQKMENIKNEENK